ncbi:hypothetical protein GE09DRAFT_1171227 [Coniochaeta sp. 2T2.1]|nr:hypothetical protein GE09DRAFT_1171227 [Coniochaeta sp. 2T2.1]
MSAQESPIEASPKMRASPLPQSVLSCLISARELSFLQKHIDRLNPTSASPKREQSPAKQPRKDDILVRDIRHATRVFATVTAAMKIYGAVSRRLNRTYTSPQTKQRRFNSPVFRVPLSLSTVLLLYRLLFRFLSKLRLSLLDSKPTSEWRSIERKSPRTASALTSRYAPAAGASLAGLALGICPSQQLRQSLALTAMFRALEFAWDCGEDTGMIWGWKKGEKDGEKKPAPRPWWWGSWMLQPFVFGQLLHAAVFDWDCFPTSLGNFAFRFSAPYLTKTDNLSLEPHQILSVLGETAYQDWPSATSSSIRLVQQSLRSIPPSLTVAAPTSLPRLPLTSPTSLPCTALHSHHSCTGALRTFYLRSTPRLARLLLILYSLTLLPRIRNLSPSTNPLPTLLRALLTRTLRTSLFLSGVISTCWASICLSQTLLPGHVLPTKRFLLGGFLAGMWAFVDRKGETSRPLFLYTTRQSSDSLLKVGKKRGWWRRGRKGGLEVGVFVLSLAVLGVVYERERMAIRDGMWRGGVGWVRGLEGEGGGRGVGEEKEEDKEGKEKVL